MALVVRNCSHEEFGTAVDWAREEGWNPGLDDLPAFFAADPNGFFMGFLDGEPVSSISVVRYGSDYGFLGFYIVAPEHRGKGIGYATWKQGMAYLEDRTVGLDGVVDQQDNYRASGFVYAGRSVRYSGVPRQMIETENVSGDGAIVQLSDDLLLELIEYDRPFFPSDRASFLTAWTQPQSNARRRTWVCVRDNKVSGYITMRACGVGYKVGPLFADNGSIAKALLASAVETIADGAELTIDVPEANGDAVALAQHWGLQPVFETARMYRVVDPQNLPEFSLHRTHAITSFELG
ncbi:MAG: GNAT family N-acetyltransferase [Pseudomonadota bacterium]